MKERAYEKRVQIGNIKREYVEEFKDDHKELNELKVYLKLLSNEIKAGG